MTVSVVTAGSTTAAVVGVGASQVTDPGAGVSTAASALAFTGAPHLALEGFVGAMLVMTGVLIMGLARRHRERPIPAAIARSRRRPLPSLPDGPQPNRPGRQPEAKGAGSDEAVGSAASPRRA